VATHSGSVRAASLVQSDQADGAENWGAGFMKTSRKLVLLVFLVLTAGTAYAQEDIVWGINLNAQIRNNTKDCVIEAFDIKTGKLIKGQQFTAPNKMAKNGDGRGILVVQNTKHSGTCKPPINAIYYTIAGSGKIFITDTVNHADCGVLFDAVDVSKDQNFKKGIADLAGESEEIWANPYVNFKPNGKNLYKFIFNKDKKKWEVDKTFHLQHAGDQYDGLEVTANGIVANISDGLADGGLRNMRNHYYLYDMQGKKPKLVISTQKGLWASGITFDFINSKYVVSAILGNALAIFDPKGKPDQKPEIIMLDKTSFPNANCGIAAVDRCLEDLSFVHISQGEDSTEPAVPEP
jgi:hypothetical protein